MAQQGEKKWYKKWWIWLMIVVVLIGIGGGASQESDSSKSASSDSSDTSNATKLEPEKKWNVIATLEGTEDNKQTDVFTVTEGDVRIRYEIEGKTDTATSLLYLLKEGTTKTQNERGELDLAASVATVIGSSKGQKIVKSHAGNYFLEINSSGAFNYKIYVEQQ